MDAAFTRWRDSAGTWQVLRISAAEALVALRTCDGGEEVERLRITDPDTLAYLLAHPRSDD